MLLSGIPRAQCLTSVDTPAPAVRGDAQQYPGRFACIPRAVRVHTPCPRSSRARTGCRMGCLPAGALAALLRCERNRAPHSWPWFPRRQRGYLPRPPPSGGLVQLDECCCSWRRTRSSAEQRPRPGWKRQQAAATTAGRCERCGKPAARRWNLVEPNAVQIYDHLCVASNWDGTGGLAGGLAGRVASDRQVKQDELKLSPSRATAARAAPGPSEGKGKYSGTDIVCIQKRNVNQRETGEESMGRSGLLLR